MASVEDVQPVDTMWLSPRNPKRMETSLASVPMGMVECLTKGPLRHVAGLLKSVFLVTLKHGNRSSYQTDRRSWRISSSGGTVPSRPPCNTVCWKRPALRHNCVRSARRTCRGSGEGDQRADMAVCKHAGFFDVDGWGGETGH